MDADLNEILKEAANENNRLKDQIEALEDELEQARNGGKHKAERAASGALCVGCYHWRMLFAALVGLMCGLVVYARLHRHPEMLQNICLAFTKRENAEAPVLSVLLLLTVAAPVLATVGEWKWMQFKHGAPGVLRTIANVWDVIRGRE
jgi:hypothetical protein